ncbi:MAG TPA: MFS transporter, partial [Candidatus Binatia bacterium]|nr:MFS transporter [Candidatus Binatia bacterium]
MRLDGWLFAVCVARTCMTSVFMTYAAVLPVLRTQWEMSATAAGSISTGFQLGYAVALVAFSAMADRVGARRVFFGSAWLSAVT